MNVAGIVVEYNPFHNGHAFHVSETRKMTNADLIVAVMSGNFLQRGEPALVSKWERTKMALAQGVDLVVELPYAFSTQHAETFANGAISILNNIGCNSVCFGSESGNVNQFEQMLEVITKNKATYNDYVKSFLKKGYSYPAALSTSFTKFQTGDNLLDLTLPNNILGYHYIKAIQEQKSTIKPFTLKREQAQYHDKDIPCANSIASATSIRESLVKNSEPIQRIAHVIPETTHEQLQLYLQKNNHFQDWERLFPFLKYKILTSSPTELQNIYEAEEGLENRIIKLIDKTESFHDFMGNLKTKRYTWTRLQRLCLHILTNITKEDMSLVGSTCPYIRLLGMSHIGKQYMNKIKKQISIPLITTISNHSYHLLEMELRASRCYSLGYSPKIQNELIKQEYAHPPVILNS